MALWHDRRGRFSLLRAGTLLALASPGLALVFFVLTDNLGPRPFDEATHMTGLWTVRFLLLTLLVTPMRRLARLPKLIDVRRMMGVACFCYIALHLALYFVDQAFDLVTVASEIVLRIYLTIGFVAWLGLAALAATSNNAMVRRLGGLRWRRLHWLVYPIAVLACTHYFMQAKLEVFEPTVMAGIFGWAMLYRIAHWALPHDFKRVNGELPLWFLGGLAVVNATLAFVFEAIGSWLVYGVSPLMMLELNFTFVVGIRPGWYVLTAGTLFFLIAAWRLRDQGIRA